jgi:hypothetical protein
MKTRAILTALPLALPTIALAAANSAVGTITNFVPRSSGYHSLFLSVAIPSQGCTLSDRAVIDETDPGGKALLATTMMAITGGNNVDVRVDGCVPVNPAETADTAPKIVKIGVRF